MITYTNLQTEFARDFGSDNTSALQACVNRAYRLIGDAWGELADDGALYLAAHLRAVALRGMGGATGQIQTKKVGDVSVSYGQRNPKVDPGSLSSTAYGEEFLRMLYTLPDARFAVDQTDNLFDGIADPASIQGWSDENL